MPLNRKPGFNKTDVIVIGSGPSGQKAALQAAKAGRKVVMIESSPALGGFCVHTGTLPSKSLRESIYRWALSSRGTIALESDSKEKNKIVELPDMKRLLKRRDRVSSAEAQVVYDQLTRNHVTLVHGKAKLLSEHEVEVKTSKGKQIFATNHIVIAVGARPVAPEGIAVDGKQVFDSDSIYSLKKIPKSLIVLGAGIIGSEFASMFSTAGTKVLLVDRRKEILPSVDREVVAVLLDRYREFGMQLYLDNEAKSLKVGKKPSDPVTVELQTGEKLKAEAVLVSLGRLGNTEGLGLQEIGIEMNDRGLIQVNSHFQTSVPSIFAVGDVIGAPALASTSMEQGRRAACNILGIEGGDAIELYPYGIYTIPEISMVGPTEEVLKSQNIDYVSGTAPYKELARGQIVGDRTGLLKLLVDRKTHHILAVHIIGSNAANLVHIGQAVMALKGTVHYFANAVFNYPTMAEAYKTAALNAINQIKGFRSSQRKFTTHTATKATSTRP